MEKTAAFFNKTLSNDERKALMEHLSFANMKSNPAVNYEEAIEIHKKLKLIDVDGEFIRNGKVNQWQGAMPECIIEQFDKLTKEKLVARNLFFGN